MPENNWLVDYGTACMKTQLDWLHANRERILADSAEAARNAPHKQPATDALPTAAE
jgi:hypothetical protein